jgi:hypothetical protein
LRQARPRGHCDLPDRLRDPLRPHPLRLDGKPNTAILLGMIGAVGGYTGAGAPWMTNYRSGDTLYVFSLFDPGASTACL